MSLEVADTWALNLGKAMQTGAPVVAEKTVEPEKTPPTPEVVIHTSAAVQTATPVVAEKPAPAKRIPPTPERVVERTKIGETLSASLVGTGRANATPNEKGKLGGKADKDALAAAEASAQDVLDRIEGGTQATQAAQNKRMEQTAPLAHAVSGHGPGTDQVSRLVTGRRNDELLEEEKKFQAEFDKKTERKAAIAKQIAETDAKHKESPPTPDVVEDWAQDRAKLVKESEALTPEIENLRSLLNDKVTLHNPQLGQDVQVPKRATVGDDPNNKSGAFSTSQGMLHVVTEAFAQADLVSAHLDAKAREKEAEESKRRVEKEKADALLEGRAARPESELTRLAAEERMANPLEKGAPTASDSYVANIPGRSKSVIPDPDADKRTTPPEELGYNLEVVGKGAQGEGLSLAHDEAQERYAAVERTGDLQNARVVLNPAYVDGKRAGYNLQTAYANSDAPAEMRAKPEDLKGTLQGAEAEAMQAKTKLDEAKYELAELEKKLAAATSTIEGSKKGILAFSNQLKGAKFDPEGRDEQTLKDLLQVKREAENRCLSSQKKERAALLAEIKVLEVNVKAAENTRLLAEKEAAKKAAEEEVVRLTPQVEGAKTVLAAATKTSEAAEAAAQTLRPPKAPMAKGDGDAAPKSVTAGYDAATGTWKGDRPAKPGGGLSGKDEKGKNLTAHHLYPWNQIRADLDKALQGDAGKLKQLLDFAEVKAPSWLWPELKKAPKDRDYRFSEEINRLAAHICWSPKNVMMGPIGEERSATDDPHEKLDAAFTKGGLATVQSAAAALTDDTGGIGATPTEANEKIKDKVTKSFLKRLKVSKVADLDDEQRLDYNRALADAGEWEGTKANFPRQVAINRSQDRISKKYQELVKKVAGDTGRKEADFTEEECAKIAKDHWEFTAEEEEKLKPENWEANKVTEADLTAEEQQELAAELDNLGMGYEAAKTAFLQSKGKTKDTELTEAELTEMEETLAPKMGPRQRLARKVVKQAQTPEGADAPRENKERPYSQEEWTVDTADKDKKKKRTGIVKAPPGLTMAVMRFETALQAKPKPKAPAKKGKGGAQEPPPAPTKADWEETIQAVTKAKEVYEQALAKYQEQAEVAISFEPDAPKLKPEALLQRYPYAREMLELCTMRLKELGAKKEAAGD